MYFSIAVFQSGRAVVNIHGREDEKALEEGSWWQGTKDVSAGFILCSRWGEEGSQPKHGCSCTTDYSPGLSRCQLPLNSNLRLR